MPENKKGSPLLLCFLTFILSYLLLIFGVMGVLGKTPGVRTCFAFGVFSLLCAFFVFLFALFKLPIAFYAFLTGLLIGYFEMFRSFSNRLTGWGDLAGILSLFVWAASGLLAGVLLQMIVSWFRKHR